MHVCAEEEGGLKEAASGAEAAAAAAETGLRTAAPSQPAPQSATAPGSPAV